MGVRASCDGNHPFTHDEVVRELLATSIGAHRLFSQSLASNDLVFKLDVFQTCTRAWWCQSLLPLGLLVPGLVRNQVVVKGLRVEHSVVGKDWVVQIDAILSPIYCIQYVSPCVRGILVASVRAKLVQSRVLDAFTQHVFTLIL